MLRWWLRTVDCKSRSHLSRQSFQPRVEALESRVVPSVTLSYAKWTAIGPAPITNGQDPGGGPVSGRVAAIAGDPTDPNTIYVAPAGGGVWKTSNGGTSWSPLTDSQATTNMGAIAVAPSNH